MEEYISNKRNWLEFAMCNFDGRQISCEALEQLIDTFTITPPYRMQFSVGEPGKKVRYDEKAFKKKTMELAKKMHLHGRVWIKLIEKTGDFIFTISLCKSNGFDFVAFVPKAYFEANKAMLIEKIGRLFYDLNCAFAYVCNRYDADVLGWLTREDAQKYSISEEELCGIDLSKDTSHLRDPHIIWSSDYDKSYLPSEQFRYSWKLFMSAPYMWCGADMNRLTDEKKLKEFSDCEYNREIYPGVREICLWENINEYCHPEFRRRQWAFKNSIIEDVRNMKGKEYPFEDKRGNAEKQDDTQMEMFTSPEYLKHGGELLIKMYFDKKKKPIGKSFAKYCVIREMKGNDIVFEEIKEL